MSTRPRKIHEVMNLEVILVVSSELSLDHFFISSLASASALHESRKKLSFGLSLNTWQEKNIELKLSLAWIKQKNYHLVSASIHDRKKYWIEPQPWMNWFIFQTLSLSLSLGKKLFMTQSRSQSVSGGKKSEKSQSHWENFYLSAIHSRLREDKK